MQERFSSVTAARREHCRGCHQQRNPGLRSERRSHLWRSDQRHRQLSKNGTGTLCSFGTNTYSGGTTINAGTLQLGNGGTTGSIAGDVTNNGILAFDRSNVLTFDGVISGTGSVQQNGTGTTVLVRDNTYSGGTTINAGTLQLGNGGTTGSIAGDVTNNGILAFDRSNVLTFGGVISGTGSVQQNGTGTTVLVRDNTYSGGTTINAGTLQLGNGGTTGSIAGDVTNNGILAFDRSNVLTFDGVISGTGSVQQNGTGTTVLVRDNTYTGATTVNAGSLIVDGSIASAQTVVNAGALLGGHGSIGGGLVNSGIVSPGDSPGTLTVSGNYTQNAAGTLRIEIARSCSEPARPAGREWPCHPRRHAPASRRGWFQAPCRRPDHVSYRERRDKRDFRHGPG